MRKIAGLWFAFLLISFSAHAQGTIKGKLMDTAAKHGLGLATVTIFKAADTALITYRLSTNEGEFKVSGIPLNQACRAVISFTGYNVYRKEFVLTNGEVMDMGTIIMTPSSNALDEVLIVAERPPVTVRKDTIEFNAASFKTLPTALVEDLLRKMPGVQVDAAGNITFNGKRVNRLMVDGKAFFGDDPKMATRNLPANVIDKVQVADDKDEIARNTDGDLTNVGKVINLTLKKGIKKGWFGKAYAGTGTRDRYEVGGIANIFRDTLQLSVLGYSNNINRSAFSMNEVQSLGGFDRSGYNSMMVRTTSGGGGGFALNDISFGGLSDGIARSSGGGFNLNHAPNKKQSLFLQYFLGNTRNYVEQLTNTQQFFNDTSITTQLNTLTNRSVIKHNVSGGANLKPDTLTDISIRASYAYSSTVEDVDAATNVTSNKNSRLSRAAGEQFNNLYGNDYSHSLYLTRRFKAKRGRVLNLSQNLYYSGNLQRYITESLNEYFYPTVYSQNFSQLRRQDIPTLNATAAVNLAEPLSKKWTARLRGSYQYSKEEQEIGIYDKDATNKYENLKYLQSSGFQRLRNVYGIGSSLSYKINKLTLTAGIGGLWQNINNNFNNLAKPVNQYLFNVLPNFSFNWKQLSAQYNMNVSPASISYLNPVPDSTNPFFIRYGNPYLKPARRNSFYISNYNFFQGQAANFNVYANATFTDNDVILSRTVARNGVQTTTPVNANGSISLYTGMGFNKEFKNNPKFIYSFRIGPNFNFNQRKLLVNGNSSVAKTVSLNPNIGFTLNWSDIVELKPQYSPGISRTTYTDKTFTTIETVTQGADAELIVRWPKKLVWETAVNYRYNNQVAPGLPKDNLLWNAALTLLMLKGDAGMLKLSVYDILNRNNGFYRYTTQNQIVDQQTNVLKRYGMLTFTYNIRNLGASKKVGGRDRLFLF